jgi:hypothetical protein
MLNINQNANYFDDWRVEHGLQYDHKNPTASTLCFDLRMHLYKTCEWCQHAIRKRFQRQCMAYASNYIKFFGCSVHTLKLSDCTINKCIKLLGSFDEAKQKLKAIIDYKTLEVEMKRQKQTLEEKYGLDECKSRISDWHHCDDILQGTFDKTVDPDIYNILMRKQKMKRNVIDVKEAEA